MAGMLWTMWDAFVQHAYTFIFRGQTLKAVLLLAGLTAGVLISRALLNRLAAQTVYFNIFLARLAWYVLLGLATLVFLSNIGVDISPIWGAAGLIGFAAAFASQTLLSSVISGLYLSAERSVRVGDMVSIGGVTGSVTDIGVLALKIKTTENKVIRIPNEKILKEIFLNYSLLPSRVVIVRVGFDIEKFNEDLLEDLEACVRVALENEKDELNNTFVTASGLKQVDSLVKQVVEVRMHVAVKRGRAVRAAADVVRAIVQHESLETLYVHTDVLGGIRGE